MSKKFEAVKIKNPDRVGSGYEVRTKDGHRGWLSICDTWAWKEHTAKETAELIARLLNENEDKNKAADYKKLATHD